MDVSVIIVSYNTAALLEGCLNSLRASKGVAKEIFVVDNCSADQSAQLVADHFPEATLIVNDTNKGFGAANNQALKRCSGRYIVFLNPDTQIKPDTLQKAVEFMDAHQEIGLAGAKILNPDGTLQDSVSYCYPGERYASGETAHLPGKIACVLGAFMIARRDLMITVGGFDEDFFLYGEDQDLAWRIRETGFEIGYIPEAEVFHWSGQSEINTPETSVFEKKLKAEYLFYRKHYQPRTIARIRRAQRIKALYRLLTLALSYPFARNRKAHAYKAHCYRFVLEMTRSPETGRS
jgi:GT2 family glycosyltransferase